MKKSKYIKTKSKLANRRQVDYEVPEFSLGGDMLANIGSGVLGGAPFGLPGMIGGGVLGLAQAAFGHNKEEQALAEQESGRRKANIMQTKLADYEGSPGYYPMYAMGGPMGSPDIEVEGGENMLMDNGQDVQIPDNAPSHEQGGVPFDIPTTPMGNKQGGFVFSDREIVPGTKKSFADLNKELIKNKGKYKKVLDNPFSTRIAKDTAKRNLQNILMKQTTLAKLQEKLKQPEQAQDMQGGGMPQFALGGPYGDKWSQMTDEGGEYGYGIEDPIAWSEQTGEGIGTQTMLQDPIEQAYSISDQKFKQPLQAISSGSERVMNQNVQIPQTVATSAYTPLKTSSTGTQLNMGGLNLPKAGFKDYASAFAPSVYNLIKSATDEVEQYDPSDFMNVEAAKASARLRSKRYNVEQELRSAQSAYRSAMNRLGGLSTGTQLNLMGDIASKAAGTKAAIYDKAQNFENKNEIYAGRWDTMAGAQNARMRYNTAQANSANLANRDAGAATSIGQLSTIGQTAGRDSKMYEMDAIRAKALMQMFPDLTLNQALQWVIKNKG